jgi:hypothetical protein
MITTVEEAKKAIKKQHNVEVVESILKGHKWFLEDTEAEELSPNQSAGTHFATDQELISTANDICEI